VPLIVYPSSTTLTMVSGVSTRKRSNASVSRRRVASTPSISDPSPRRLLADRSKRALQIVGDGQELARKIRDRGLPRLAIGE
jgi:hypothetical protein